MERSLGIGAGRRWCVAALVLLVVGGGPGASRAAWDLAAGPSRIAGAGSSPASPLSLRPTQQGADPQGHGYGAPSIHVCGPHVCVHWVIVTLDAPPLVDGDHDLVPDQVEATLGAFERAWRVEVDQMGFRAPESDGASADHGPDDRLDVYLADVGANDLSGYVATDDPRADDDTYAYRDYSAYIVVDDDFSVAQLGVDGGPRGLRATAAHELFHAVQYAYDAGEDAWLTEGTAVWMEDAVADDADANRRWLRSSALEHPWVPVDSSRGLNEYGAWIFWRFLTESQDGAHGTGATLIRSVWQLAAQGPGDAGSFSARALQVALEARARSLPGALATFGAWNLAPSAFYQEGAAYPPSSVTEHRRVRPDRPMSGWSTVQVNHLATSAISFEPQSGAPGGASLLLTLDAPPRDTGPAARVVVFLRSGRPRVLRVVLDADGDADVRVPFSSEQVRHVVLVMANGSTSFRCWTGAGYSCNGRSRADEMPFRYRVALVR